MIIYSCGFWLISSANTIWPIIIANLFLTGAAADLLSPWIYNETSKITPPSQKASAQAIVTMGMHVGALTSAPLQLLIMYLFKSDDIRILFVFAASTLVIAAIIAFALGIKATKYIKVHGEKSTY